MYEIDLAIFRFFNQSIANPAFDFFFPIITSEKIIIPIYIILLALAIWKGGRKGVVLAIFLIIGILLSDQISSHLIKTWISRPRPCHTLGDIRLLVGCGSGKSFPSSHAFNNATAAFIISRFYPNLKYYAFSFAGLVAISRLYVGVHYPSDVLGGFALGLLLGWAIISALKINKIKTMVDNFIAGKA